MRPSSVESVKLTDEEKYKVMISVVNQMNLFSERLKEKREAVCVYEDDKYCPINNFSTYSQHISSSLALKNLEKEETKATFNTVLFSYNEDIKLETRIENRMFNNFSFFSVESERCSNGM